MTKITSVPLSSSLKSELLPIEKQPDTNKISNFAKQFFKSSALWFAFLAIGCILFTPIVIHLASPTFTIINSAVLAVLAAIGFKYKKEILYEVSLLYTITCSKIKKQARSWYTKIDDQIYLGAIPLKNKGHLQELTQLAGKNQQLAILSAVEPWELTTDTIFSQPVTPEDWKKNFISQKTVPAIDFKSPTVEQIKQGVQFIKEQIKQGKKVYIHCKAGRGRSALMVACYYMDSKRWKPSQAIDFIKSKRPFVVITKQSKTRMEEYYNYLQHNN